MPQAQPNNGALTTAQLLGGGPIRELIMLAGKDGVGKTSSIVSLAWYLQNVLNDKATFYVIDTENKFRSALKSFGADAPTNIRYYKCDTMNDVTKATATVLESHKPGDWLAVESLSRVWERAQDLAYLATEGMTKVEYLERRSKKSPIPNPDKFWQVAKGAHDGAFFDLLTANDTLNVIMTTTVAKPPKPSSDGGRSFDSPDRKAVRIELGIDSNLEGAPRIPYYVETLAMLDIKGGRVSCRILRDNQSKLDDSRIEFEVPDRKSWAPQFWSECRE